MTNKLVSFRAVSQSEFIQAFKAAQWSSANVRLATSPAEEVKESTAKGDLFILSNNGAGFVVKKSGELVALHSTVRGQGSLLVQTAVIFGATHLDCFDGFLPKLYAKHGFVETHREPNWTPGQPDVVFMTHYSHLPLDI